MHPILYAILGVVIILVLGPVSTLSASSICKSLPYMSGNTHHFREQKLDSTYISISSQNPPRFLLCTIY